MLACMDRSRLHGIEGNQKYSLYKENNYVFQLINIVNTVYIVQFFLHILPLKRAMKRFASCITVSLDHRPPPGQTLT